MFHSNLEGHFQDEWLILSIIIENLFKKKKKKDCSLHFKLQRYCSDFKCFNGRIIMVRHWRRQKEKNINKVPWKMQWKSFHIVSVLGYSLHSLLLTSWRHPSYFQRHEISTCKMWYRRHIASEQGIFLQAKWCL